MGESQCWEVDRLAARTLLDRLKIEATPATVEQLEIGLAEHRRNSEVWVAGRVQSRCVKELEDRSMQDFTRMDDNWRNGFMAAEEIVATLSIDALLDQPRGEARSKGEVLRSMVRDARKRSALVERRTR
ncbi:hypothetical protein [Erythrobacter sp.]|uniref:hypothetical protein n=1 Tax=Erythrobacter sp. TaxID=1042 RepID=UPI00311D78F1